MGGFRDILSSRLSLDTTFLFFLQFVLFLLSFCLIPFTMKKKLFFQYFIDFFVAFFDLFFTTRVWSIF